MNSWKVIAASTESAGITSAPCPRHGVWANGIYLRMMMDLGIIQIEA